MTLGSMNRFLTLLVFTLHLSLFTASAQTGTTAYEFMNIPVSAHAAAVGGNNVSMVEDDVTLMFSNPALLSNVSNKTLNFNFMTYMASSTKMSAAFAMQAGERGTWALGAQVLSYGSMTETTAAYEELGSFNATDIALQGGYTYLLSDEWSGGVQGKVLMSNYNEALDSEKRELAQLVEDHFYPQLVTEDDKREESGDSMAEIAERIRSDPKFSQQILQLLLSSAANAG